MRRPRGSTLFPYTTLFRSWIRAATAAAGRRCRVRRRGLPPGSRRLEDEADDRPQGRRGSVRQPEALAVHDLTGEELDRKSTRLNSSHGYISNAVFCSTKQN